MQRQHGVLNDNRKPKKSSLFTLQCNPMQKTEDTAFNAYQVCVVMMYTVEVTRAEYWQGLNDTITS